MAWFGVTEVWTKGTVEQIFSAVISYMLWVKKKDLWTLLLNYELWLWLLLFIGLQVLD